MQLTSVQTILTIVAIAVGVQITRFAPFVLFPDGKKRPLVIDYLGKALPPAMMGLLVVYCLRNISVVSSPYGIPELVAIIATVGFHKWKSNALLSIATGTACYMFMMHVWFS
ncbi:MAG: branched-chain amino acid transporter AzlD [Clostridia bacterium]|nr:branched-chain amino acid transporter AzlD [Clostridia bacterium]